METHNALSITGVTVLAYSQQEAIKILPDETSVKLALACYILVFLRFDIYISQCFFLLKQDQFKKMENKQKNDHNLQHMSTYVDLVFLRNTNQVQNQKSGHSLFLHSSGSNQPK